MLWSHDAALTFSLSLTDLESYKNFFHHSQKYVHKHKQYMLAHNGITVLNDTEK